MIKEKIGIENKFQLEFKLGYPIKRTNKKTKYEIDMFLFIPYTLNINKSNYDSTNFYKDVYTYLRYKTPRFKLKELIDDKKSPLAFLLNKTSDLHLKMFCNSFRTALKQTRKKNPKETISNINKITEIFRNKILNEKIKETYYTDEFMSLLIEFNCFKIFEKTKDKKFLDQIDKEIEYRKKQGYKTIAENPEYFIYKRNILKKHHFKVLYLTHKKEREGKFFIHMSSSISAGLAMVFATAIGLYAQYKYDTFTTPFFITLVVAYMIKDQIKEFLKSHLKRKLFKKFYDSKIKIYDSTNVILGNLWENFSIDNQKKIPDEIKEIREKNQTIEIENDYNHETIIHYKKKIELFPRLGRKEYRKYKLNTLNDITRINFKSLLKNMDDPYKKLYVRDKTGFKKIKASKVYYINVIIRYFDGINYKYSRNRVILNSEGIKKIVKIET
ncbi:hypothetical protein HOD20_09465 [archaeon]|jgi:hypothetical protein|nr:hypothetical protein [archaeon]MBT4646969.1 hypothetical protein [archaeon]MBT6822564.1 hypothetical protein [archaeon]MBT7392749.1 hypothetical protein [archaeon]